MRTAISLSTWYFWCLSHVFTALYALTISSDVLMAGITWANATGCLAIATLTQLRRRQVALPAPLEPERRTQ